MNYKSQQHKTIFEKAVKKKDKSNRELIAAMYLLTADSRLWQIMQHHIEQNNIDFSTNFYYFSPKLLQITKQYGIISAT